MNVRGDDMPIPWRRWDPEVRISRSRCSSTGIVEVLVMLGGWMLLEIRRGGDRAILTFDKEGRLARWNMFDAYHAADVELGGLYWIGGWSRVTRRAKRFGSILGPTAFCASRSLAISAKIGAPCGKEW